MKINYPKELKEKDKMAYLYRMQELIRLEHNEKGKDYREKKISREEFDDYCNDNHMKKQRIIADEILKIRKEMKNDDKNIAKINDFSDE